MTRDQVRDRLMGYLDRKPGAGGVAIDYVNHRGERSVRRVLPATGSLRRLKLGDPETKWHPAGSWAFDGYDLDKGADRTFACDGVHAWEVLGELSAEDEVILLKIESGEITFKE